MGSGLSAFYSVGIKHLNQETLNINGICHIKIKMIDFVSLNNIDKQLSAQRLLLCKKNVFTTESLLCSWLGENPSGEVTTQSPLQSKAGTERTTFINIFVARKKHI